MSIALCRADFAVSKDGTNNRKWLAAGGTHSCKRMAQVVESSWRKIDDVEMATLKWVDWFNNRRLLEPIGNIPPAEAEELYYAQINQLELVA